MKHILEAEHACNGNVYDAQFASAAPIATISLRRQAQHLSRLFALPPATATAIATLHFGEGSQ